MHLGILLSRKMLALCMLMLVGAAMASEPYEGLIVIDVTQETREQAMFLRDLKSRDHTIDFWQEPGRVGKSIKIMLHRDLLDGFVGKEMADHGMTYTVYNDDVKGKVDRERQRIEERWAKNGKAFDIDDFNTLDDINIHLEQLKDDCISHRLMCDVIQVGTSHEGRAINVLTLSTGNPNNPDIYIDSGTHAREWTTPATLIYIIDNLINNYSGSDPDVAYLVDNYNWHFIVVENPDGYEFSWLPGERYWRKNRTPNAGSSCIGTDLNRNFNYRHCTNGADDFPCSDTYCGSSGNSELETQAVSDYLLGLNNPVLMVTLHCCGHQVLHPWGNTIEPGNDFAPCDFADDHDDLFAVSEAAGLAIENTHNEAAWEWGNSCDVIYTTTGATDDYSKAVVGIKYAYNPEIRGSDFVQDATEIFPSFQEIWNGVVAFVQAIEANPPPAKK